MTSNRFNRFMSGFRRVLTGPTIQVFFCAASASQAATLTWDGTNTGATADGGPGTWDTNTTTNWWDGANNVVWPASGGTDDDAVFANAVGTVSLASGGVTANDLTFSTTGYTIQNDTLTLNGSTSVLTTDPGVTATISSMVAGAANVTKSGTGTLVLSSSSANTLTGKMAINAGVLSINADARLGTAPVSAVADQLTLNGGSLLMTAAGQTLNANRGLTLGVSGGTISTVGLATSSTTTLGAVIAGSGPLTLASSGDMSATGGGASGQGIRLNQATNTFTGNVTITSGLVSYANNASFGNAANQIILNGGGLLDNNTNIALSRNIQVLAGGGTFRTYGSTNVTWSGNITGAGNINRTDGGTLSLSGDLSGYSGTFNNLRAVTVLTGSAATIGGNWNIDTASGGLRVNSSADQSLAGIISGAGTFTKQGVGTLTLTGVNTQSGATTVSGGILRLGDGTIQPTVNSTYNIQTPGVLKIQYNTATGSAAQTWSKFTGTGTLTLATGKTFDTAWGNISLNSAASGWTGTLRVEGGRAIATAAQVLNNFGLGGTTAVTITPGGHLGMWEGGTFAQNFTVAGTGYGEGGYEAALRLANEGNSTIITGSFTLAGNTTLGARLSGLGKITQGIGESSVSNLTIGTSNLGGTVSLNGASTYSGNTTVAYGTLSANGSLTSPVTVNSGATLAGRGGSTSSTLTLNAGSNIAGVASVVGAGNAFRAAGAVSLGGVVNVLGSDGNATVGSHTIDVVGYGGSAPLLANFGTTKYHSASVANDAANQKITLTYTNAVRTWNATSSTWDNMTTAAWQEGDFKFAPGDAVVFNDSGAGANGARAVTVGSVVNPGSVTFANNISPYTLSGTSGNISGPISLSKSGAAKLTLSTGNSYTGGTSITGGLVEIRTQTALGTGAATITGGGTLAFGPSNLVVSNDVTLNGGTLSGGMDSGTVSNTYTGNLTLGAGGGTLTTWWSDKSLTVTNPITGAGNLSVSIQQAGNNAPNIYLMGANSYTGTTTINAGNFQIGNAAYQGVTYQLPIITGGTSGTLSAGDVINNGNLIFARINNVTIPNAFSGTGNIYIRSNQTTTFSGSTTVSGSNLFIRHNQGSGATVLFNKPANSNAIAVNNVYIGGERSAIYGNATTLSLAASEQIADSSIVSFESGRYGGASVFSLMGNSETVAGLVCANPDHGTSYAQNNAASGTSTLTINTPAGSSYSYQNGTTAIIRDGAAGKLNLVKNGNGTQILQHNDHTGTTSINAGILRVQSGRLNSSATTLSGGTLDVRSSTINAAISGSSGLVSVAGGAVSNFGGGNKTYSVNTLVTGSGTNLTQTAANSLAASSLHTIDTGSTLTTGNFAGSVKALAGSGNVVLNGAAANLTIADGSTQIFSGIISGAGNLTKSGSGTQIISGDNTHTGGTAVTGGNLVTNNPLSLGINGNLTVTGGTFTYQPNFASALDLGTGVLSLANGTRIGTALGGGSGQSAVTSSSAATAAGAITVDVYGIPGETVTAGSNAVIMAASGLGGATYTLGNIYNATNFTVSGISATDTAVSVTTSSVAALTNAYWKGGLSGGNNVWALSNGTSASNWTTNAAGTTATALTPGVSTIIQFSATGATNQGSMLLGANMNVAGIVASDSSAVGLAADGNTLTLGTSGITVNSGAGAVTLAAPIQCSTDQSWQNNSANTLTLSGAVANPSSILTTSGSGNILVSGNLSGGGFLHKNGAGILTLSGTNSNTGDMSLDGGTLKAGSTTAFGGQSVLIIANAAGTTFDITGFNTTVGSISGGGASGGTITLGAATLTTGGTGLTDTFSGTITGTGGLAKTGTATFTLDGTGSNTHSGTTTVYQGALSLGKTGGATAMGGNLTFDNVSSPDVYTTVDNQLVSGAVVSFVTDSGDHGRLELLGTSQTVAGIQTVGYTSQRGVVQNREMGPANTGTSTLTLNGSGSYTFTGYLRDGGAGNGKLALTKSGSGTQTLQGSQIIHTGNTTVSGGTLRLVNPTGFASAINNSTSVEFNTTTATNFGNNVALSGAGTFSKTGPATLAFNGTQAITASGQFNILEGTLQNNGNNVNWSGNLADIDVSAGAILDLFADAIYLDTLTGSGVVQNNYGNTTGQSGAAQFLEKLVLGTNGGSGTFNGVIRNNSAGTAPAAANAGGGVQLEKIGSGTQTLAGANSYTGTTTVTAGTLLINGSLASGSAVTVASGATLGGSGNAAGTVTANGAIAPGNSIGTLSAGATTFGATGSLAAEINSTALTADRLSITGNLSITSGADLSLTDIAPTTLGSATKLVLVSYTGTWNGVTFAGKADDSTVVVGSNSYTLNYNDTVASVNAVTLTAIVSDPFGSWASSYGLTGPNATKGADPDGDGVKNLLEFATASDPTSGSSGPRLYPLMHVIGADTALTYTMAVRKNAVFAASGNKQTATKDGVVYTVEGSNNLIDWTTVQVTEVTGATATAIQGALGTKLTSPPLGADWEWHTFRTDGGAPTDPSDFIHLRVTESP